VLKLSHSRGRFVQRCSIVRIKNDLEPKQQVPLLSWRRMNNLLTRPRNVYNAYPRAFWTYNIIVFIDRLGGFMLYPFFALYLTQKFDIGMSTVGILLPSFPSPG
jgi:hypothetical protein